LAACCAAHCCNSPRKQVMRYLCTSKGDVEVVQGPADGL
jgi:hypothetical protein